MSLLSFGAPSWAEPPNIWAFTQEPDGDAKLGITSPGSNTYGLVLFQCRPGSKLVRMLIDIADGDLAGAANAIRRQDRIPVTLAAGGEQTAVIPDLVYNNHDSLWWYAAEVEFLDPLIAGLKRSGRLTVGGPGARYDYSGEGIGRAMPAFMAACAGT